MQTLPMNPDHTPKIGQSDLLCGSKLPIETRRREYAFSSELSFTAHERDACYLLNISEISLLSVSVISFLTQLCDACYLLNVSVISLLTQLCDACYLLSVSVISFLTQLCDACYLFLSLIHI